MDGGPETIYIPGMSPNYDESWTQTGIEIVNKAIEKHGGWNAWNKLSSVAIRPLKLNGVVPSIKGYSKTFSLPQAIEIFPKEQRVVFRELPGVARLGEYLRGDVKLYSDDSRSEVTAAISRARNSFSGMKKIMRWSQADSLYFFGYAWTTYLNVPFVLPKLKLLNEFEVHHAHETWNAIRVEFPEDFESHSKVQTFYFDRHGSLRRNDYVADIIGRWAMGAHYSEDYVEINQIQVALKRRVYARIGTQTLPINALSADLEIV